jgi:hypothetical protein
MVNVVYNILEEIGNAVGGADPSSVGGAAAASKKSFVKGIEIV